MIADLDVSFDRLTGDWRVYQLTDGHRFSTDDMLTAWMAAQLCPRATRLLDLGAGIGSVGLMTLAKLRPDAHLIMVEAQEVSHRLARATVAENALDSRVTLHHGDLRSFRSPERFDLITGSPPYFPLGTGKPSPHPQKAACRMELRGTIADYAQAAAAHLDADGSFVACFPARDPRGEAAFAPAGLHIRHRCDVIFRAGHPPMITLWAAAFTSGAVNRWPSLTIRGADGRWTPEYLQMRREMGSAMD